MISVFYVLLVQVVLGALDNLWHHEITEKLPSNPNARHELAMHTIRELLYGVIFVGLAWYQWQGIFAYLLVGLLVIELIVTLIDFIIEDKTRILPAAERVLHTILAINIGIFFAVLYPVFVEWAALPDGLVLVSYGLWSWAFTVFGIMVFAWGIRDMIAVMNLHILKVPQWQREPFKKGRKKNPKTYLITGGTGFIGVTLIRKLISRGDDVIILTRDLDKAWYKFGRHVNAIDDLAMIDENVKIDCIINLAGEALAGGLWTKGRKEKFYKSRLETTRKLDELIARLKSKPARLINASAIGYYGDCGDENVDETSDAGSDFMADLCHQWEREAQKIERHGVSVVRLRIGLVLDKDGAILPPMALSAKLFGAMVMGSGKQWMSWISRHDLIRLIMFIDESKNIGSCAINGVAPEPVTQRAFIRTIAGHFNRPVLFKMPGVFFKTLLGEMSDLFLQGQKVLPRRAEKFGFTFQHRKLEQALDAIYDENQAQEATGHLDTFYNADCPVCDAEISHYQKVCAKEKSHLDFVDVNAEPDVLEAFGLTREEAIKRLYVRNAQGQLLGGVDAFIEIWGRLSRYRFCAKILKVRVVRWFGAFLYDGICVPVLDVYNRRRIQKISGRKANEH